MDIERLKELKGTVLEYKNTRAFDICFEECDEIVKLIDEAIARIVSTDSTRVTDEAVRGIVISGEYLATLNDDNLADLVILTNEVQNYINESLVALRQMRTGPCEWCEIASACEYEVTFFQDDDRWATERSLMPNFCPNCGRKLGE